MSRTGDSGVDSPEDAACVGLRDEQIGIGGEQQARGDEAVRGGAHRGDVAGVVVVALLEGEPRVDADGNEVAGLRSVGLEAPLGTHTGWNLRRAGFAEDEECGLTGSFIPFAATRAQREASGDPRLSLEERYGDHAGYVAAVRTAADRLVAARLLLQADADLLVAQADASSVLR